MDTDDLSNETYEGVIIEAEKFDHDLTLRFGVLASDCKNEEQYLDNASELIDEIRSLDEEELTDLFFGRLPDINALNLTLDRIINNINRVKKIPEEKRNYEF